MITNKKKIEYIQIYLIIVTFVFVVSCGNTINVEDSFKRAMKFELKINKNENSIVRTIDKNSEKILKLKIWFNHNSDGWQSSITSYATPDISIIGNDLRLLIYKNGVVLGYTDFNGKPKQYTKKVAISEFDFLTNISN